MTTPNIPRKALRTLTLLVIWLIWRERNSKVFNGQETSTTSIYVQIKEEASSWIVARFAI